MAQGNLIPTVAPAFAKFRGASSSQDFNTFSRAAYSDIVAAYAALANQYEQTVLANEILSQQYKVLQTQIAAMQDALNGLQLNYASLSTFNTPTSTTGGLITLVQSIYNASVIYGGFNSYYPSSAPLSAQGRANYESTYGQIIPSLAVSPTSKTYVIDVLTQQVVLPPNVISTNGTIVSPTIAPFAVDENDQQLAVDGDSSTCWRRNVYFSSISAVSSVETTITLTIPEQYVNNLLCNYVTIHPYPEFGVDITSVVLTGAPGAASQQLLPFDSFGNIIPISQAGKTRLLFPDTQVVSVQITLRQSNSDTTLRPGLQAYCLGASVLDFGYATLNQNTSVALIPFSLSNNYFSYISEVTPTVTGVTYNLYYLDPTGDIQPFTLGSQLPGFVSTIYVETAFDPTAGVFPVVDALQIQYYPVYST
jgi:hypothetical protein